MTTDGKEVKIIQIFPMENNALWQGCIVGLGSDGVVYSSDKGGAWEVCIKNEFLE